MAQDLEWAQTPQQRMAKESELVSLETEVGMGTAVNCTQDQTRNVIGVWPKRDWGSWGI